MSDYSPAEFERMQRDAQARVKEMQKKSKYYTDQINEQQKKANIDEIPKINKNDGFSTHRLDYNERRTETNESKIKSSAFAAPSITEQNNMFTETLFLLLLSRFIQEDDAELSDLIKLLLVL